MKRALAVAMSLVSHRLVSPAVCTLFLFCYIGVTFFTDEALVTLVQLVGKNPPALGLLALAAINALFRMAEDIRGWRMIARGAAGRHDADSGAPGSEAIVVAGCLDVDETTRILRAEGYRVFAREGFVNARRGTSLIVPRLLWRLTVCLLFAGVALSLMSRQSMRVPVIEGEPLALSGMPERIVERITLEDVPGHWFLQRRLAIDMADRSGSRDTYGVYPPGSLGSRFLYPRYLSVAPLLRIAGPGFDASEGFRLIMLYPPGREDVIALSGDYRLKLVIPQREGMPDPFVSGRFDLHVRLLKGDQLLAEGDAPFGGRFESNGFVLELLDARRYVVTDFVRDYGVLCIWLACIAALLSVTLYLPVRVLWPLREIRFSADGQGGVCGWCRSEGGVRRNEELFHGLLDRICRNK